MSGDGRRERVLATIAEITGRDGSFGSDTRLGDVGLDSLAFIELALTLERELGIDLSSVRLDERDRVADLVRSVEAAGSRARPPGLPPGIGRLQRLADLVGDPPLRWWFALRVVGAEHVPARGPVVVAMNHESALDIPIVVIASPRPITFMAKRELFKSPFASWSLRELGAFRVDRSRFDVEAVEVALAALERGHVLGMYPEGTRSPGRLLPFQPGAAWIAARTGAPIVPCSVSGTERVDRARRPGAVPVRVEFHPPIEVEQVEEPARRLEVAAELTDAVRATVAGGLRG
jgi:1-acyl-sn-glycerol-3-phosphate acyltransferase